MTIKWKLTTGFGVLIFLSVFFGIVVTANMTEIQEQFRFVIEHDAPVIANANKLLKLVVDMETGQRGFCLTQNEEFLQPYNYANIEFYELLKIEKKLVSDNPIQVKVLNRIGDLIEQWHIEAAAPEIAKAREAVAAEDKNEQYNAMIEMAALLEAGTGKAIVDEIRAKFADFIKTEEQLTNQRYATASKKTLNTRNKVLSLVVFSVFFGIIIASLTVYTISSSLKILIKGTEIIGSGDLNHRIELNSKNEIGQLSVTFNQMVDKLQQVNRQVHNEIAERKQAQEALAYEKQRLSYILEGTNVGTWEWNVQTGETIFNERWAEVIGYMLEDLKPVSINTWMKFCHPDDLEKSGELLNKHFVGELDYYEFEARMKHRNGDWVWVLDRGKIATWTNDGKPLLVCGTHQNITERKRIENELQILNEELEQRILLRTEELEKAKKAAEVANQAKSDLLVNMSHELRTPLNAVLALTGIMTGDEPKNKLLDFKSTIESSSYSLLNAIEQILEYTKNHDGVIKIREQPFKLSEVLSSINTEFLHKGIKIKLIPQIKTDGDEIPNFVIGDKNHLLSILNPLLENAAKFTPDKPEAIMTLKMIEKSEKNTSIQFSLSDKGIGIVDSKLEIIFEPFTQADVSSTRSYDGTGMGLSLCKQLVELNGGKIWVTSQPEKGSTFFFTMQFGLQAQAGIFDTNDITLLNEAAEPCGDDISELDREIVSPQLKNLREALLTYQPEKVQVCLENLNKHKPPQFEKVRLFIEKYEYEEALEILNHIIDRID
ncbi:CHASE3 domain-containing protein [Desulfobacterales bacterium HSG17]|nr:CHASE3 domain-containing protein [Desulfobacterales bacterium HSG17]